MGNAPPFTGKPSNTAWAVSACGRRGLADADFASLHEARNAYERDYILKKLEENAGNMTRTAEVLGLERSHLYRKMKSLGLDGHDAGADAAAGES